GEAGDEVEDLVEGDFASDELDEPVLPAIPPPRRRSRFMTVGVLLVSALVVLLLLGGCVMALPWLLFPRPMTTPAQRYPRPLPPPDMKMPDDKGEVAPPPGNSTSK